MSDIYKVGDVIKNGDCFYYITSVKGDTIEYLVSEKNTGVIGRSSTKYEFKDIDDRLLTKLDMVLHADIVDKLKEKANA